MMNPFDEGYNCAKKGGSYSDNPYISENRNWHLWNQGFESYWSEHYYV